MHRFLETIRISDGVPQHAEWHQLRVNATMQHFYPKLSHDWQLNTLLEPPVKFKSGITRCRIEYDDREIAFQYFPYTPRPVSILKILDLPEGYDYRYKYADRNVIDALFERKGKADDILMVKNGWIKDTSIANIAFGKNNRWYTPSIPLLAGTTWKRLVSEKLIIPCPIHISQLQFFEKYKLFNAMLSWEDIEEHEIDKIKI